MASAREQIMLEVMSRLEAIPDLLALRNKPMPEYETPAFAVALDGGHVNADESDFGYERIFFSFDIEVGVMPDEDVDLGTAINSWHSLIVQALVGDAGTLNTLGRIRETGMTPIEIGDDDGQGHIAVATISFDVDYQRAEGNPEEVDLLN